MLKSCACALRNVRGASTAQPLPARLGSLGSLQCDTEQIAAWIEPFSPQRLVLPGPCTNFFQILVRQSGASAGGAAFILASAMN